MLKDIQYIKGNTINIALFKEAIKEIKGMQETLKERENDERFYQEVLKEHYGSWLREIKKSILKNQENRDMKMSKNPENTLFCLFKENLLCIILTKNIFRRWKKLKSANFLSNSFFNFSDDRYMRKSFRR